MSKMFAVMLRLGSETQIVNALPVTGKSGVKKKFYKLGKY